MRKAENFRQRRLQATAKIQRQEKFPAGQREVTDLVQHVYNALPARHSALRQMKKSQLKIEKSRAQSVSGIRCATQRQRIEGDKHEV
ncbi:hypothetical protein PQR63_07815 [Herbaspirillum rhizosphaerae]|uniref:Transposase n=1 Tax=Herbaspirillum rhizosphaerae TaxID=346179 RepID=A0ABW8Z7C4_9BURK